MGTTIRAEISKDNKYYISKDRFLELKHFCLQYPEWKARYIECNSIVQYSGIQIRCSDIPDPVAYAAQVREHYLRLMEMVEQTAIAADSDIYQYIIRSVAFGISYTTLRTKYDMPCGKDMFYDRYRKFFWLLDKVRENLSGYNETL